MFARTHLQRLQQLDPERDYAEICFLVSCHEFPFDVTRADEFALFRTFAVPSISALLDRTGEFEHRPQRRYDDTVLILSEILENGFDSERGRAALRRMNQLHGRFEIANEDFLYVLSTFVFEPMRWIERYGWRPLSAIEREGTFHYWRHLGGLMNIRDIPGSLAEFEAFNLAFERDHFRYAESNRRVADANCELMLGWLLPQPLWLFGRPALYAMMDEPLREALGYPAPSPALQRLVQVSLRLRGRLVGWLPERREPHLRTRVRRRSYRGGYEIGSLGPGGDG